MLTKSNYYAILPILNRSFNTFITSSWWLTDDINVRELSEAEARLIQTNAPEGFIYDPYAYQKAIIINNLGGNYQKDSPLTLEKELFQITLCSLVVFNLVSELQPIVIPYGVIIKLGTINSVEKICIYDSWGESIELQEKEYRIANRYSTDDIQTLFNHAQNALSNAPELEIIIKRFSSALVKINLEDRIIDLTISLECLIPAKEEVRFRFSYYLSLLIENSVGKRKDVFRELQSLYDARSVLVHGNTEDQKSVKKVSENWKKLVEYAKTCLFYRVIFESQSNGVVWKEHLQNLSFGEKPIIY